ncbi:MAG: hypothetical protein HY326_04450 [Chloroflexi bacterium]|nr:hypothetical protein [Chloroflexota bacterium]
MVSRYKFIAATGARRESTMPLRQDIKQELDPSAAAMIAEHERLSGLYLYNAEMSEKSTSLYLTATSVGTAALLGLAQMGMQITSLLWPSAGFLAGILLLGILTFQRLIERRIRATEFLRAINRTHNYFVQLNPDLEPFYFWPPYDDVPPFGSKGAALGELRDAIAALNSLFFGALTGVILYSLLEDYRLGAIMGIIAIIVAWWLHRKYEEDTLAAAGKLATRNEVFTRAAGLEYFSDSEKAFAPPDDKV